MRNQILEHYLKTGTYTYAGPYGEYFRSLPDEVDEIGHLVCAQVIHRVTLREGNTNANDNSNDNSSAQSPDNVYGVHTTPIGRKSPTGDFGGLYANEYKAILLSIFIFGIFFLKKKIE